MTGLSFETSPISLAMGVAANTANTPEDIALWMKTSSNQEVSQWGYRLEAALLRERVKELEQKEEGKNEHTKVQRDRD